MKIIWLDCAIDDLRALRRYIAKDNHTAALRIAKKIVDSVDVLSEQPGIGRQGRISHTRELIITATPYIVPYRVKSHKLEVLRVLHASMQWPISLI